jgi:transcriptional regulator with XRE-family HTH domain
MRHSSTYNQDYRYLIAKLRETRLELGLLQREVCAQLGKPPSWLSKIELGERRADPIELAALAQIYKSPMGSFFPKAFDSVFATPSQTKESTAHKKPEEC